MLTKILLYMMFANFDILEGKEKKSEVTQSCLTLCNSMDCSLQGSSIHGIFQARVLSAWCFVITYGVG